MSIKEMRASTKMTQKAFAKYLNIPVRTLQDWEAEKRTPPEYVVELIKYKIKKEKEEMKKREERLRELENMKYGELLRMPKVATLEADSREVEYLERAEIMQDTKIRGAANVYFPEKLELNEYEYLLLQDFADKYKKSDGLQDMLYADIKEVFEGIMGKLILIK